jgi:hypothetical protein
MSEIKSTLTTITTTASVSTAVYNMLKEGIELTHFASSKITEEEKKKKKYIEMLRAFGDVIDAGFILRVLGIPHFFEAHQ